MGILHSENGKLPQCYRKSAFLQFFCDKSGNSALQLSSRNSALTSMIAESWRDWLLLLQLPLYVLLSTSMWHGGACWDCNTVGWSSVATHMASTVWAQGGWCHPCYYIYLHIWFILIGYNVRTDFISSTVEFNMHTIGFDQILKIGSYKMEKQNGHIPCSPKLVVAAESSQVKLPEKSSVEIYRTFFLWIPAL